MVDLESEKLPSDGSFQMHKLLDAANERLSQLGKRGKRAKLKRSGNSITLQFNFQGQKNPGCGCSLTKNGIREAEKIASLVTGQLSAGTFSWEWFNSLIGKKIEKQVEPLTGQKMISEYKAHWFKENKKLKKPHTSWYLRFKHLEKVLEEFDAQLSISVIRSIIERTDNNSPTRSYTLQALSNFLEYFRISDYRDLIEGYKAKNKPTPKKRNVPSDARIKAVFKSGFFPAIRGTKKYIHRFPQWQFLYGLLAVYGLRVHEAWNIANWDKPVTLHQGDWVVIENNLDEREDQCEQYVGNGAIIPAILDPTNTDKILCIKHNTKTGYRMVMPLSPEGENWIEEFNLIQPFNLPDIKDPLGDHSLGGCPNCTNLTCHWFTRNKYGFTPHDLRHAYNHRGHHLGYNLTTLSKSLGHSLQMNSTTYLKTMPDSRSLEMIREAIASKKEKQSELERLKAENGFLKQEIEKLKTENHLYKSLLEQVKLR